ncbi:hypothetical protein EGI32_00705 [Ferruginibacter sp. HRS2-29]|nr:hypothetical protein [Ferruginibacter sp. HRS2-29]
MQSLTIDLSATNGLELPEINPAESSLAEEALAVWERRLQDNNYLRYRLNAKLSDMKEAFAAVCALRLEWHKAAIAIRESGGSQAEIDYFNNKQKHIQPKILTCGRIAQLRLQLSIDLLLAEASLLNQYLLSATADKGSPMEPIVH